MDTGILPIADRTAIAPPQSVDSRAEDIPRQSNLSSVSATDYSTPDVQVSLSQRGRQLSIETFEKETIQAAQTSQAYQTENRAVERQSEQAQTERYAQNNSTPTFNLNQIENDQTIDISTQEAIRLDTGYEATPLFQRVDLHSYPEVETPPTVEVRDQTDARREEEAKIQEAINTATVVPANSSQSASVASQYNTSPESALGHSISTFA